MVRQSSLAVGQRRELKHPSRGRHADHGIAEVEILAIGQPMETRGGNQTYSYWQLHDDGVHVRLVRQHDWRFEEGSSRQTRQRPMVYRDDAGLWQGARTDTRHRDPYSPTWQSERLPKGEYLVRPSLLGELWDDSLQGAELAHRQRLARAKAAFAEAVEGQREQLTRYFVGAQVSAVPISWGHTGTLSLNDLAAIINHAVGKDVVPIVNWLDYQPQDDQ